MLPPLLGLVDGSAGDNKSSIRIKTVAMTLAGTYNCVVTSTKGFSPSAPLHLHVVGELRGLYKCVLVVFIRVYLRDVCEFRGSLSRLSS